MSGETRLSLTRSLPLFLIGFIKFKQIQIKIHRLRSVRMNCTSVPQILKSNQACKCTGCITKMYHQNIVLSLHSLLIVPLCLPIGFPFITALSRCICTKYNPAHRLRLSSVLMCAAYVFCQCQRSNGTNHVCPQAPVMSLPAQFCIAFGFNLSVVIKKRCLGESRSRLGLG